MIRGPLCIAIVALSAVMATAQPPIPPQPGPADPIAGAALSQGIEALCVPFLSNSKASPATFGQAARTSGYEEGSPDPYASIGEPVPDAPPAMSFHKDAGAGSVIVFLTVVPTACQIRVKGDAAAWSSYLADMPSKKGRLIASAALTPKTAYSHEVYVGGVRKLPKGYTLFVNRWVGQGAPKNGVWTVINVLPDS